MESLVIGYQKMVLYKQCLGREEKGVEVSALNMPKTQTFLEQKDE